MQERRLQVAGTIRSWRAEMGMTQVELADQLGVPQSWVSNVESGSRRLDIVEAELIAEIFGISVNELLDK